MQRNWLRPAARLWPSAPSALASRFTRRRRRIGAGARRGSCDASLRERRFDIVHANEAHALTAAWLARAHRRAPLVAARRVAFPLSRGYLSLARYRAAACIVAISQAVREQLLAARLDPAAHHHRRRRRGNAAADFPGAAAQRAGTLEFRAGRAGARAGRAAHGRKRPRAAARGLRCNPARGAALPAAARRRRPIARQTRRAGARGASCPDVRFAGFVEDSIRSMRRAMCLSSPRSAKAPAPRC